MWRLFKFLGFIISWVAPFGVLYVNHVVLVETTQELDMFGLIVALILLVWLVKKIDSKIEVKEIQDRNRVAILSWKSGKKIAMGLVFIWMFFSVEDNITKLQWTTILITACFIIGYILTLLGELMYKKRKVTQ